MPHGSLRLKPGVNTNRTPALNEAAISESNLVRFVYDEEGLGLVQKIGGWVNYIFNFLFTGVIREMHVWQDLNNTAWLAMGSDGSSNALLAYNATTNPQTTSPVDITPANSLESFMTTTMLGTIASVSATGTGAVATLTFSALPNGEIIPVGQNVTVAGLGSYNGNVVVTASTTASISYSSSATGAASGGTITSTTLKNYGFSTTGASADPTVRSALTVYSVTDHTVGDYVYFPSYINVGNLLLSGPYYVTATATAPSTYTISVGASTSIISLTRTTNVVTVITPDVHTYYGGQSVVIYGTTTSGTAFDGTYTINAASITPNSFTFNQTAADGTGSGGYITPNITTGGVPPLFTTVNKSATVTVNLLNHGLSVGDSYYAPYATTVGGVTIQGLYTVISVLTDTSNYNYSYAFTISASLAATSSASTYENYGVIAQNFLINRVPTSLGTNIYYSGWVPIVTTPAVTTGYISGTTLTLTSGSTGFGTISSTIGVVGAGVASETLITSGTYPTYTVNTSQTVGSVGSPVTLVGFNLSGTYGADIYSTASSVAGTQGTEVTAVDWTLDNWGQILISCPKNGSIYYWIPVGSAVLNSSYIPGSPLINRGMFIAMPQRQIIAYGSSTAFYQDPLLVRWCDVSDFTTWIGTAYNQAGQYRIPTGSQIIGGLQVSQQGLLWTDIDLWAMQYIGAPLVYGFNKIGSNCGLIGQKAAGELAGTVYWMSQNQFWELAGGGPVPVPCPIRDLVFQNKYDAQDYKIRCATNTHYNEVTWYYAAVKIPILDEEGLPTGQFSYGNGEVNAYVKYNTILGEWDYGYQSPADTLGAGTGSISGNTLTITAVSSGSFGNGATIAGTGVSAGTVISGYLTGTGGVGTYTVYPSQTAASTSLSSTLLATSSLVARTAWVDQSILGNPIGAATTGSVPAVVSPMSSVYQQEITYNADGFPLRPFFKTGYYALTEGDNQIFVDQIWPDMKWNTVGGEVYTISTATGNGSTATLNFTQAVTIPVGTQIMVQNNSTTGFNTPTNTTTPVIASSAGSISYSNSTNGSGTGGTIDVGNSSRVSMTFYMADYPDDVPTVYGPYFMTSTTRYLSVRMRGRLMQIGVSSDDSNSWWRIGNIRYKFSADGKY